MSLKLRWVGENERDRVAETRMRCYAPARKELSEYVDRLRNDSRCGPGDWLLAEDDAGTAVGTATVYPMTMWVRGGAVPCQGVAWVGTIKTHRRRRPDGSSPGIATAIMNETLRVARERGQVVSALMPFRGSFYEKFGYGFVERRNEWRIPMSILPRGDYGEDCRFYDPARDFDALVQFKQRLTERTHGDIERPASTWRQYLDDGEGHLVVERSGDGPIRGFLYFEQVFKDHVDTLRVEEALFEDGAGLLRQ
jgi:predicted acetyltransferase